MFAYVLGKIIGLIGWYVVLEMLSSFCSSLQIVGHYVTLVCRILMVYKIFCFTSDIRSESKNRKYRRDAEAKYKDDNEDSSSTETSDEESFYAEDIEKLCRDKGDELVLFVLTKLNTHEYIGKTSLRGSKVSVCEVSFSSDGKMFIDSDSKYKIAIPDEFYVGLKDKCAYKAYKYGDYYYLSARTFICDYREVDFVLHAEEDVQLTVEHDKNTENNIYSEDCIHEEHKKDYEEPYGAVKEKERAIDECIHEEHKASNIEDNNARNTDTDTKGDYWGSLESDNSKTSGSYNVEYPDTGSIWDDYMK